MALKPDYAGAWRDIVDGVLAWQVWGRIGWLEVKRRYKRTVLGPFWATISFGVLAAALGLVWGSLFHVDTRTYLPFVTSGIVSWSFTSAFVADGGNIYTSAESLLKQLKFPTTTLNMIGVWRNIILLLHNLVIVVLVNLILKVPVTPATLLLFPGVLIVAVNGVWITLLLGMISARFRDVPPLINNIMQVFYFLTPIFWFADTAEALPKKVAHYNYFHHLMDLIRSPMLGKAPHLVSYEIILVTTIVGWALTFAIYARFRRRIPYWL